jgi:sulfur-oxidizing protein SoxX
MRKSFSLVATAGAALLAGNLVMMPVAAAADSLPGSKKACKALKDADAATKGWCTMMIRKKGNCLACHDVVTKRWPAGLPAAGNIGPPLVSMKSRFPDKAKLRAQIWDATEANPTSSMIPFGRHKAISEKDIDNIVTFLYTI